MLSYEPSDRLSISEIRAHPWLTKVQSPDKVAKAHLIQMLSQAKEHEREA